MTPTVEALTEICRIVAAIVLARSLPPAQLGAVVAALRDNGADALASCLIGDLPFEPNRATLTRLTDE